MGSIESLKYDGEIRESKLLWALGNYSLFIRPSMVRVKCKLLDTQSNSDELLISAYKNPETDQLFYVVVNLSEQQKVISLSVKEKVTVYVTSEEKNLEPVKFKANKIILSGRSVNTILE